MADKPSYHRDRTVTDRLWGDPVAVGAALLFFIFVLLGIFWVLYFYGVDGH